MRHIPNLITCLNLASGFAAVVFLSRGNPVVASWLILAAMIFDFLDGFASRLLNAYSDLGKELDSLADIVSFGVAPGLIIFSLLSGMTGMPGGKYPEILKIIVAALIPVCAGLRLARFNIDTSQSTSFKGLPTPAAALSVVTLLLAALYSDSAAVKSFSGSPLAISLFALTISGLMVSRIPLLSMKFKNLSVRGNEGRYMLAGVSVLLIALGGWTGITLIIPAYIAISLVSLLF